MRQRMGSLAAVLGLMLMLLLLEGPSPTESFLGTWKIARRLNNHIRWKYAPVSFPNVCSAAMEHKYLYADDGMTPIIRVTSMSARDFTNDTPVPPREQNYALTLPLLMALMKVADTIDIRVRSSKPSGNNSSYGPDVIADVKEIHDEELANQTGEILMEAMRIAAAKHIFALYPDMHPPRTHLILFGVHFDVKNLHTEKFAEKVPETSSQPLRNWMNEKKAKAWKRDEYTGPRPLKKKQSAIGVAGLMKSSTRVASLGASNALLGQQADTTEVDEKAWMWDQINQYTLVRQIRTTTECSVDAVDSALYASLKEDIEDIEKSSKPFFDEADVPLSFLEAFSTVTLLELRKLLKSALEIGHDQLSKQIAAEFWNRNFQYKPEHLSPPQKGPTNEASNDTSNVSGAESDLTGVKKLNVEEEMTIEEADRALAVTKIDPDSPKPEQLWIALWRQVEDTVNDGYTDLARRVREASSSRTMRKEKGMLKKERIVPKTPTNPRIETLNNVLVSNYRTSKWSMEIEMTLDKVGLDELKYLSIVYSAFGIRANARKIEQQLNAIRITDATPAETGVASLPTSAPVLSFISQKWESFDSLVTTTQGPLGEITETTQEYILRQLVKMLFNKKVIFTAKEIERYKQERTTELTTLFWKGVDLIADAGRHLLILPQIRRWISSLISVFGGESTYTKEDVKLQKEKLRDNSKRFIFKMLDMLNPTWKTGKDVDVGDGGSWMVFSDGEEIKVGRAEGEEIKVGRAEGEEIKVGRAEGEEMPPRRQPKKLQRNRGPPKTKAGDFNTPDPRTRPELAHIGPGSNAGGSRKRRRRRKKRHLDPVTQHAVMVGTIFAALYVAIAVVFCGVGIKIVVSDSMHQDDGAALCFVGLIWPLYCMQ